MRLPLLTQQFDGADRQGHVAVLATFCPVDVNQTASAIDVRDLQVRAFLQTQTAGVDRAEAYVVPERTDMLQDQPHLLDAQHDRERPLARRANHPEHVPFTGERLLVEELDAGQRDGHRRSGILLDVPDVQEVLPDLFFGEGVGRLPVVFGQLAYGSDVGFDRALPLA